MIKTQVQIPDELYHKAKALAAAKEWSMAEVFRRGLEYMASTYKAEAGDRPWELPVVEAAEASPLSAADLESWIERERDEYLRGKAGL